MVFNHNKRIINNSLILLTRTVLVTLISLFTVSELLKVLGVNHFGLFNLIFGLAVMFSFINGAMSVAIQRYLGQKIGQNDDYGLVSVFYTSIFIHFVLAFLILFIMFILKDYLLISILNLNENLEEGEGIYYLAGINIFILCIQSPFIALINIYERMRFLAYIGIFEVIFKLFSVYFLYFFSENKLIIYALLINIVSLTALVFYLIYYLNFFYKNFKCKKVLKVDVMVNLKEISSFMGWTMIGSFAWMSRVQGMNILLNIFFGVAANAAYAISNNIFNAISNLLNSISNAIKPQIFISYAAADKNRFNTLIVTGTKYFSTGLSAIAIPVMLFADDILANWLSYVPENTQIFVNLTLIVLYIESLSVFLTLGIQAIGKIKIYQIYMGFLILSSIPLTYVFYKKGAVIEVFLYILILNALICFLSRLFFLKMYFNFNIKLFFEKCIFNCFVVVTSILFLDNIIYKLLYKGDASLVYTVFSLFLLFCINLILIYKLLINSDEKRLIKSMVKR